MVKNTDLSFGQRKNIVQALPQKIQDAIATGEPTAVWMELTPDTNKLLLKLNTKNIKPGRSDISQYARTMEAGEWEVDGNTIKLTKDLVLSDGQKRLMAGIESGATFKTLFVVNLRGRSLMTSDVGHTKNAANFLEIDGIKNANNCVTAYIFKREIDKYNQNRGVGRKSLKLTHEDIYKAIKADPILIEAVNEIKTVYSKVKVKPVQAKHTYGIYYLLASKCNPDLAFKFMEGLLSGTGLNQKDYLYKLREVLINDNLKRIKNYTSAMRSVMIIEAWNLYITGSNKKRVNTPKDIALPTILGQVNI